MAENRPKHQGYSLWFWSASRNQTKSHYLVLLGKANPVAILSCADLLPGADSRPSLEWPKIDQNIKAIALVFPILECVSESNEIALSSITQKGESSGNIFLCRSAHRIWKWALFRMTKNRPKHQGYSLGIFYLKCVSESIEIALSST